ncbi:hypothetical protein D3C76_1036500 [compost metagenome]
MASMTAWLTGLSSTSNTLRPWPLSPTALRGVLGMLGHSLNAKGISRVNTDPRPSSLCARKVPPMRSARVRAIDRPRPVPP